MASPYSNGPVITLAAGDSPFNKLIEIARLQTIVLTPAAALATLNLYADTVTTNAPKQILSVVALANGATVVVPFTVFEQTPFTIPGSQRWLSASLVGAGALAFIYMS